MSAQVRSDNSKAKLTVTWQDVPLNRVSVYDKNHATGSPFLIKITRQGITIDKKIMRLGIMWKGIFRVLLQQWIVYTFGKIFMRQGIL